MIGRRELLAAAPLALAAKPFGHVIGVNLYTVRASLAKDPAGTYKALRAAGVETIEVRPPQLIGQGEMIRAAGLKPVHMFVESAVITGAWEEWGEFGAEMAKRMKVQSPRSTERATLEGMIELAKKFGIQRIGTSMLLKREREGAIEKINQAAEKCAAAGIELYYHNHAFEFDGEKGKRFIDRLHKELDKRVRLELDIFWASITGNPATEVLAKWKGRVKSVHLKDMAPDAKRPEREVDVPPTAFRELGKGTLNLPAILKAAEKAGVEHYLIELDYPPGDPVESVRNCVDYLKKVNV